MSQVTVQEIVEALRKGIPVGAFRRFDWREANKQLADRIEKHGVAPPDGWVLVPRKLTTEMLLARNSNSWPSLLSDEAEAIWDAFIASAPEVKP